MKDNSIELCTYMMEVGFSKLQEACNRVARHAILIANLMNPSHKIGKALRSIRWLEEAANEQELNSYGGSNGRSNIHWNTVKEALVKANIEGDEVTYVTLIPDKMELHNAGDELILEFASKEDYYRLIVELKLLIDKE